MTHGGFLATILDEIMAHACVGISQRAVTAEMTVRFQKTVEIGSRIRAVGKVEEARGRVLNTRGWIYDEEGPWPRRPRRASLRQPIFRDLPS